jgi:hypothetical protein
VNSVSNPEVGASITDKPALFHVSVKIRMEDRECNTRSWRSMWLVKDQPYKPAAELMGNRKPTWVE